MSPVYLDGQPDEVGVYAYVPSPTITTTTLAATYYPIAGPFTNTVLSGWSVGVDSIVYDGPKTRYVEIVYSGTFESDTNNTTFVTAVKHNGNAIAGSEATFELKLAGDSGNVSATVVVEVAQNDTIQLVVKSDQAGAEITAQTYSTALTVFFNE